MLFFIHTLQLSCFLFHVFLFSVVSPRKGPPQFLTVGHMSMTKSGLACVLCVYCVCLFSFIELYIFLCCLVLFVSTLAK